MQKLLTIGVILLITACRTETNTASTPDAGDSTSIADQADVTGDPSTASIDPKMTDEQAKTGPGTDDPEAFSATSGKNNVETPPVKTQPVQLKTARIAVDNSVYEFGRIQEGTVVEHTFTYQNTGDAPLIIRDALVDCGCTVPQYSSEPLSPGESAEFHVRFDTHGKLGSQERLITLVTNGQPSRQIVRLKGIIDTERALN
jgi:hypothetical protein